LQGNNYQSIKPRHFVLDTIFITSFLILFAIQQPYSLLSCYILPFVYLLLNKGTISLNREPLIIFLVAVGLCMPAMLLINHGYTPFIYIIMSPVLVLFARAYAKKNIFSITLSLKYSFWVLTTLVLIGVYVNRDEIAPLEGLIEGTSTNGIPSYLIVLFIAYSISALRAVGHLPIFAAFSNLIISVIGLGRGSIIVAAILLIFVLSFEFYLSKIKTLYKFIIFTLITISATAYIMSNWSQLSTLVSDIILGSKFVDGVFDESRGQIISEYFAKIDILHFFLGADFLGTSIVEKFDGNPHNSYIRVHAFYGLWGLVLIFLPLLIIFIKKVNRPFKFAVFFLIFSALVRAISEPIFFPSLLDFFYVLYFFIFYYHYDSRYPEKY
jgi:hypothetical protein